MNARSTAEPMQYAGLTPAGTSVLCPLQIVGHGSVMSTGAGCNTSVVNTDNSSSQVTLPASQQLINIASGLAAVGTVPGAAHDTSTSSACGHIQQPQQLQPSQAASTLNPRTAARLRVRLLPYLLSKVSDSWSYERSNFRIRKAQLGAARVVVHREVGCAGAYTLEASLGGCSATKAHFSVEDYVRMGHELGRGIAALAQADDTTLLEHMATTVTLPPYVATYTV